MTKNHLLLDPSLATQLGVDAALLLGFLRQQSLLTNGRLRTALAPLQRFFPFWDEARLLQLLEQLEHCKQLKFRLLDAELEIALHAEQVPQPAAPSQQASSPVSQRRPTSRLKPSVNARSVQQLPVVERPSSGNKPLGPAPTWGAGRGWRAPNELDEIFDAAEQRAKQRREMDLDWTPSQTFYELLSRTAIEPAFAQQCIDEFIAFYVERGKPESNWDQRFLRWVKQAWTGEENRRAGAEGFAVASPIGTAHEKSRQDTREGRKRVTRAVMDLKNTDW
ncbi:MAG TPA: DnaT-like ssDNA-binding domain-containing protein [Marinobacterium sp.]|nr:DnaT-like ssDNA-binding domain-containing protein [Marinobacterium sp.]